VFPVLIYIYTYVNAFVTDSLWPMTFILKGLLKYMYTN